MQVTANPISPDAYYSKTMLGAAGIGPTTLRRWRRAGMEVKYVGKVLWVKGSEVARMIEDTGNAERWDKTAKAAAN